MGIGLSPSIASPRSFFPIIELKAVMEGGPWFPLVVLLRSSHEIESIKGTWTRGVYFNTTLAQERALGAGPSSSTSTGSLLLLSVLNVPEDQHL